MAALAQGNMKTPRTSSAISFLAFTVFTVFIVTEGGGDASTTAHMGSLGKLSFVHLHSLHDVLLQPFLFLIYTFLQSKRLIKMSNEHKTGALIRSMVPAVNDTGNELRKCSCH